MSQFKQNGQEEGRNWYYQNTWPIFTLPVLSQPGVEFAQPEHNNCVLVPCFSILGQNTSVTAPMLEDHSTMPSLLNYSPQNMLNQPLAKENNQNQNTQKDLKNSSFTVPGSQQWWNGELIKVDKQQKRKKQQKNSVFNSTRVSNKIIETSKQKETDLDEAYIPGNRQKKKVPPTKIYENANRNVIPNTINQILSFIQKRTKSGHLVEQLFNELPHQPEWNIKKYFIYQSILASKASNPNQKIFHQFKSLSEPQCNIYSKQEQQFYNKISRSLINKFLRSDSISIILTSKRMRSNKKLDHLKIKRELTQKIYKMLNSES